MDHMKTSRPSRIRLVICAVGGTAPTTWTLGPAVPDFAGRASSDGFAAPGAAGTAALTSPSGTAGTTAADAAPPGTAARSSARGEAITVLRGAPRRLRHP